jgi:hypothetical protein
MRQSLEAKEERALIERLRAEQLDQEKEARASSLASKVDQVKPLSRRDHERIPEDQVRVGSPGS